MFTLTKVLNEQNKEECRGIDRTEGSSNVNRGLTGWDTCRYAIGIV
jgi:hypothetical protein